jgi:glucose/arabinose dehydrogenase
MGFAGLFYYFRNSEKWQTPSVAAFSGAVVVILFVSTLIAAPSAVVPVSSTSPQLRVPPGFTIAPFLPDGLFRPTSIAFDSQDRLFIASRNRVINVVEDVDGDGVGVTVYGQKEGMALGLALTADDRTLFVSGGVSVVRLDDEDADGDADSTTLIIDDLPSFVYDGHSNNGIAIGPDGRLYLTLGGVSYHGLDDHPLAGSILTSNLDGTDLKVYASGLRNPYDLAFRADGSIVATDNGPDFQDKRLSWNSLDELDIIQKSGNYSYPNFFGFPPAWSGTSGPVAVFPSHSVPTGVTEYQGEEFPGEYQEKVFLSLFGPLVNPRFEGFVSPKVVTITFKDEEGGESSSIVEDFATGFVAPIDVAVDSHGRLYVADYGGTKFIASPGMLHKINVAGAALTLGRGDAKP